MNKISWSEDNISALGRKFLTNVLQNMRDHKDTFVQFGETGEGVQPNYQITFANGVKWPINGLSHDSFSKAEKFDENRISQPFYLHKIQDAVKKS